jgi:hypothetical protein
MILNMKKRVLLIAGILLVFAAGVYGLSKRASDMATIKLRNHVFTVPARYSLEGSVPDWLRNVTGLDESHDILLTFGADEIAAHVPGYVTKDEGYTENITVRVAALDPVDVARSADPSRFSDVWSGTGSYKDRIVEPYKNRPWYKVFRKLEYPVSWAVLSQYPDSNKPFPLKISDFWLAECLTLHSPLTKSGKRVDCTTDRLTGDIEIEFDVSEQNLPVIEAVGDYIQATILAWEGTGSQKH